MLSQIYIKNVAVIESANVDLKDGFNVFTGETGAGKSILIDSINAVLGGRTSKDLVRNGEEKAVVKACFTDVSKEVTDRLTEIGYDIEDGDDLIISREITSEGKNTCRINMQPATVSTLKDISSYLIDVHGQHDSIILQNSEYHIGYIDSYGNLSQLKDDYKSSYDELCKIDREIKKLTMDDSDKEQRIDMLKYQIQEIESADLSQGEDEELETLSKKINSSEKIIDIISDIISSLEGDNGKDGAIDSIYSVSKNIDYISEYYPQYADLSEKFKGMYYELDEFLNDIKDSADELDFDPALQNRVEKRLDTIYRLKKKYGNSIDDILAFLDKAKNELDSIEYSDDKIKKLSKEREILFENTMDKARKLSEKRKETATVFENNVLEELTFLNMPNVKFKVNFDETKLGPNGIDEAEFYLAANVGDSLKPISKVASGGELSRIMLSIKNVLADKDNVDTLIFDEVDTGISGSAALKVGKKLKQVSKGRQIICVTHLAQVASFADNHLLITKKSDGEKTYTNVESLSRDGRVNELARIMGGEITDSLKESALELLNQSMQ